MRIRKGSLLLTLFLSGLPHTAAAQYQTDLFDLSLEELLDVRVVSSVSGVEQGLKSAPASATIIEFDEWQRRGAKTLSQALVGVAGLQSTVLSSSNAERNIVIRGLSGNFGQQIKLLIDGIPFNRVHHGGKPALDLPLLGFKRIEIVRSPGSATYGADAFAGIINLVSNDDFEQKTRIAVASGRFDNHDLGVTGSAKYKELGLIYALNYSHYGDDKSRTLNADAQAALDDIFNTQASRAPGSFDQSYQEVSLNLKAQWQDWQFSYYGVSGTFGFGAGVAEALDPEGEGKHTSHILDAKYLFSLFGDDETQFNLWWQEKHSEFPFTIFPAGAVLPIGASGNLDFAAPTSLAKFEQGYIGVPSNDSELGQVSLTSVFSPVAAHTLRWQLGFEHHKHTPFEKKNFGPGVLTGTETLVTGALTDVSGTPYAYLPERSRNIFFVSVQDTWQISEDWAVHLGGRYDDYSDFGSTTNPRVGIVWQATDALTVKLLSAKAFRAPSFFGLYAVNNPINVGNPELKPEQITTHELNLGITPTEDVYIAFSYYQYKATDIVEYINTPDITGRQAQNIGQIDGKGMEWSVQWRPSSELDIAANFSYVDNESVKGMSPKDLAEKMASVTVNYQLSELADVNVFWQYTGEQQRTMTDQRAALPSANWVSSKLSYQLLPNELELALVVTNLFDSDSATPSSSIPEDYPIAGRQWQLQLDYQF